MTTKNERTLFLHWTYHPSDITRQTLRCLYDETLAGKDGFDKMTICYSRPRNLRESLTRTSLTEPEGERVSDGLWVRTGRLLMHYTVYLIRLIA
jgi:hypothetical protein